LLSVVTVTSEFNEEFHRTYLSLQEVLEIIEWIIVCPDVNVPNYVHLSRRCRLCCDLGLGIYEAMNVGLKNCTGSHVMYINAGDELYLRKDFVRRPVSGRVPVRIVYDEKIKWIMKRFPLTKSYIHQGIVFPNFHAQYDTRYRISADYDLLISGDFAQNLIYSGGYVNFYKGGFSDRNKAMRDKEIFQILIKHKKTFIALFFWALCRLKNIVR